MSSSKSLLTRNDRAQIMKLCKYEYSLISENCIEVQSMSNKSKFYKVFLDSVSGKANECECPDHQSRKVVCKHMIFCNQL